MCATLSAQVDTSFQHTTASQASKGLKLKPRIGLGMGSLVFYGDIGRDNAGYNPASADMGYMIDLTNELTPFLDLRLYSVFGTITINEVATERMLNMQTQLRSGGMMLSYNFHHLLPSERDVEPFIGAGIEAFEFLSKSDMYDANGMRYHYWSDGSIRNLSENDPNADQSILLVRDHVYETDLRELNRDGYGRYAERSFAIPVSAGLTFKMTNRFKARLAATYHFTFTDLVDNMTDQSAGARQGNRRNDQYLFTSVSLNYDLNPMKVRNRNYDPELLDDNGDFLATLEDTDGDGVPDIADKCQATPEGVSVDKKGCAIDSDGDGFPDYLDAEPHSAHHYVDADGVAMYDDEIYNRYLMWHDSIPWQGSTDLVEDYAKVMSDPAKAVHTYHVRISREDLSNITQEEINTLLSFKDVQSIDDAEGGYLLVGNYQEIPEAIRRKIELSVSGFESDVVTGNDDEGYTTVATSSEMEAAIAETYAMDMESQLSESQGVHFRVQVGAFRYQLNENIFLEMGDVMAIQGGDGLTRYVTRSYDSMEDVASRRIDLLMKGFDGAFITAYRGGKRVTLAEAGMTVKDETHDLLVDEENNSIDPKEVTFRVQLAAFIGDIPTHELDKLLAFTNVNPRRENDGKTYFLSAPCETMQEVNKLLTQALQAGLSDAIIIGEFNGKLISAEDARKLKGLEDAQVYLEE
jgi:hypothetical protein